MPARIAVLGAPGTGRSTLCLELASRLRARGHQVLVISSPSSPPEVTTGVTPDAAPAANLVIEDAPDAPSLEPCELALLMGLDLPAGAGAAAQALDASLRETLTRNGVSWRVIYGRGPERVQQALRAVAAALPWAWSETASEADIGRWSRLRASCEKCGDADCEHRLFTGGLGLTAPPT